MSKDVKIIEPSGILDSTKTAQFRSEVNEIVNAGASVVLIDMKDVTFVDSSGLGALVVALKAVRASGSKLFICGINEQVRILFELTSMDRVFEVYPTRADFEKVVLAEL